MNTNRKGKTKYLLLQSREAAMNAVQNYNNPNALFRSDTYIVLMIIAWTKLFHAYFNQDIGDRYYYLENGKANGRGKRYKRINGEKKAWDLSTCIEKYRINNKLTDATKANLEFFIYLRNKIEHRYIESYETFDSYIFGECQALLYNYEKMVTRIFGNEYALMPSLSFSLQFSEINDKSQGSVLEFRTRK